MPLLLLYLIANVLLQEPILEMEKENEYEEIQDDRTLTHRLPIYNTSKVKLSRNKNRNLEQDTVTTVYNK